jgi:hypothetical protein
LPASIASSSRRATSAASAAEIVFMQKGYHEAY